MKTIDKVLAAITPSDLRFDQSSFLFKYSINAFVGRIRSTDAHRAKRLCVVLCVRKDAVFAAILEAETNADLRPRTRLAPAPAPVPFINSPWAAKRMQAVQVIAATTIA